MKIRLPLVLVAAALPLAACGGGNSPAENLAERVEEAGDNRASAMEDRAEALRNEADMMDNRAERTRDVADSRADAIEAADMNVARMDAEKRDAIVANEAPAVR